MTPDLWKAKKIVDSTLHPGGHTQPAHYRPSNTVRYGKPRLPSLPHVLLRHLQPHCHCRHAHAWPQGQSHNPLLPFPLKRHHLNLLHLQLDKRHTPLANHKPISQRRHQQRQCQQIYSPIHLRNHQIILARRLRILLCRPWPQYPRSATQTSFTGHKNDPHSSCPFCRCRFGRRIERFPHARRGDPTRHRRLSMPQSIPNSAT